MGKWKRPWGKFKPPERKSYLCVFNDGGDGDNNMNVGVAIYDSIYKTHFIYPSWLTSAQDERMVWWKELPNPPKESSWVK